MRQSTRLRRWALATCAGMLMSAGTGVGVLGASAAHADAGSGNSVTVEHYVGTPSDAVQQADAPGATAPGDDAEITLSP